LRKVSMRSGIYKLYAYKFLHDKKTSIEASSRGSDRVLRKVSMRSGIHKLYAYKFLHDKKRIKTAPKKKKNKSESYPVQTWGRGTFVL